MINELEFKIYIGMLIFYFIVFFNELFFVFVCYIWYLVYFIFLFVKVWFIFWGRWKLFFLVKFKFFFWSLYDDFWFIKIFMFGICNVCGDWEIVDFIVIVVSNVFVMFIDFKMLFLV